MLQSRKLRTRRVTRQPQQLQVVEEVMEVVAVVVVVVGRLEVTEAEVEVEETMRLLLKERQRVAAQQR